MQQSLGAIPDKFAEYWTRRFPLLLLHTWLAMQCIKSEPIFSQYYNQDYQFNAVGLINANQISDSNKDCVWFKNNYKNSDKLTRASPKKLKLSYGSLGGEQSTDEFLNHLKRKELYPNCKTDYDQTIIKSDLHYNWRNADADIQERLPKLTKRGKSSATPQTLYKSDEANRSACKEVRIEHDSNNFCETVRNSDLTPHISSLRDQIVSDVIIKGKQRKINKSFVHVKKSKHKPVEIPIVWTLPLSTDAVDS